MSNEDCIGIMNEIAEQDEKEAWFEERTAKHIALVQGAAKKIVEQLPEFEDLLSQVENHDATKFEEPERTPYIEITWRHKDDHYDTYKTPGELEKKEENDATMHHILNNSHHPEFHNKEDANIDPDNRDTSVEVLDATKMPATDLAEMVADWQAMSEELGNNTAREWYDTQKDVRWHFSEEQDAIISKCLSVFEDEEQPVDTFVATKDVIGEKE